MYKVKGVRVGRGRNLVQTEGDQGRPTRQGRTNGENEGQPRRECCPGEAAQAKHEVEVRCRVLRHPRVRAGLAINAPPMPDILMSPRCSSSPIADRTLLLSVMPMPRDIWAMVCRGLFLMYSYTRSTSRVSCAAVRDRASPAPGPLAVFRLRVGSFPFRSVIARMAPERLACCPRFVSRVAL